jgi:hypothetical protein
MRPQGYPKATSKPPQCDPKAASKPPQSRLLGKGLRTTCHFHAISKPSSRRLRAWPKGRARPGVCVCCVRAAWRRKCPHIVTQRIVSCGRSREGSGFAHGNRSVDTEGFCKSQVTLNSGLRWLRATLGRVRWNGRNSVPVGYPQATLRPCGSQRVGTPRPP